MKTDLVLASASPRRRELLEALGIAFDVVTADVPELDGTTSPRLSPAEIARKNARLKAHAVAQTARGAEHWVLGADTVVALDGRLFGKPASPAEACDFLHALGGRTHEVITGCALFAPDGAEEIFHDVTRVTFLPLTDAIIGRYLAEVNVLDKAGAYALQERGEWIVEQIQGSRNNVIGLPTEMLEAVLRRRGLI